MTIWNMTIVLEGGGQVRYRDEAWWYNAGVKPPYIGMLVIWRHTTEGRLSVLVYDDDVVVYRGDSYFLSPRARD